MALPRRLDAQQGRGTLIGIVTDSAHHPVPTVTLRLAGTRLGAQSLDDGSYKITDIPSGLYTVRVSRIGFRADSFAVAIQEGATVTQNVALRGDATQLATVTVTAARLGETKEQALQKQKDATNIVTVLSGDEIRSLPNYNAAEAAGRIPGVSLERDEGEGKFVQVRGTEPRLTNVTIDGSHVPGTQGGDRIVKLDDVPSDILGAIEVSKTLTADMDADAIGGSVNLVTKRPGDGPPRGYVAGQYGAISLNNRWTGQGGFTYGGHVGADEKLGFLIGGSAEKNTRGIHDVEPSWGVSDGGQAFPNDWNQRDYIYNRKRYGVGGGLDYRFSPHSSLFVQGLWSLFQNEGTRYVYDVSADGDTPGAGAAGMGTDVSLERTSQYRTPHERMWGVTAGGKQQSGDWTVDYTFNGAGTRADEVDYRTSAFEYAGPNAGAMQVAYDGSNVLVPTYRFTSASDAANAVNPSNYQLGRFDSGNSLATGRDLGGTLNVLRTFEWNGRPGALKFGARYRDEKKDFNDHSTTYDATGNFLLQSQVLSNFSDPGFYRYVSTDFSIDPVINNDGANAFENAHMNDPAYFANVTDTIGNLLGSFSGSEKIYAAYVMGDQALGTHLHLNVGLRVEATHSNYLGHVVPTNADGDPLAVQTVTGAHDYTDLFPSIQLRYAIAPNTNVRAAFTRGIARPNYSDLAPSLTGSRDPVDSNKFQLSAGNPDLRAQHSWNYDVLAEHFFPAVGVISGGVFYKSLSDVLATEKFVYTGPLPEFVGFKGTHPANVGNGYLFGFEMDWTQHLTFLAGPWSGIGFDVNWTHTQSKVDVPQDDGTVRRAPLLRQSPNIFNGSLLYDWHRVSGRVSYTYNGAMIGAYGDGTATPNGDNYFYAHGQIDASILFSLTRQVQLQLQGLNLNNEVFGFFQGLPNAGQDYTFQREYYGRTFYFGTKLAF